jgi:hypothetical protein
MIRISGSERLMKAGLQQCFDSQGGLIPVCFLLTGGGSWFIL